MITVLYNPRAVFEDALSSPKLLVPILIFACLTTLYVTFYFFSVDAPAVFEKEMLAAGKEDQLESIPAENREAAIKVMKYGGPLASLITIPLWFVALGFYFWLFARIFGLQRTLSQGMIVPVYAYPVAIVSMLIGFIIMLSTDFSTTLLADLMPSNASYFLDPDTMNLKWYKFWRLLDIFVLWKLIVSTIGASVVLRTSYVTSAALIFVPWLLWNIGALVLFS